MRKEDNGIFGEEQSQVSIKERVSNYLSYWPLFLVSLILCVGAGYLYTKYTVPKYMASTTFLIIGAKGNPYSEDLVQSALNGKKEININNELLMLNARNLMERTVEKNNFNILYLKKGKILDLEIYNDAPFTLTAKGLTKTNRIYKIYIKQIDSLGGNFLYGPKKEEKKYSFRWDEPFVIDNQVFVLSAKTKIQNPDGEYIVIWEPVEVTAAKLSENYTVKPYDTKTYAIQLSVKTENLNKGKDVLNAIFNEFNQSDIEDRNKLSHNTVQFIDDRLASITGELKGVEGNLENYQGSNQLIDIKSQSAQSLGNANEVSKNLKDLAIQQEIVSMILNYFNNPSSGKLVPSSLGLNDATLSSLITQYNELQLRKERETPLVAPNSTVMQDLNTQIGNLRSSILESLSNISKNLKLQEKGLQQQNNQYQSALSSVPHNERVMQEIKRKQGITEGLYLYLFQKREEAAISSTTSSVPHYKQLDVAVGYGPVEPDSRNIYVYCALLGLFLAFGFIYLKDLLNDTITSRDDVSKITPLHIIGQVSHIPSKKRQVIAVNDRNVVSEQFRAIRTNLSFLLKEKNDKTILITSGNSGEGKSFISLNLAAVFATPGKKVALLEFDIRNPIISDNLNLDNSQGLTSYLSGEITDISRIVHMIEGVPNLHLYPSGPVPDNPADLLLADNLAHLFEILKAKYDYIIIDSAPAGLVSDPFIMRDFTDLVLYIVRSQKTTKKQLDFVNEIVQNKSLNNVNLILNDIKDDDQYGYGYGSNNNYGSSQELKKKKKKLKTI